MPQGYRSTPTIFNALVQQDLRDVPLPDNTVLVQYVDDLLLASTSREDCMAATRSVLLALETASYKCKREKLHLLVPSVQFLGGLIGADARAMTRTSQDSILQFPKPQTV